MNLSLRFIALVLTSSVLLACAHTPEYRKPPARASGMPRTPDFPGEYAHFNNLKRLPPGVEHIPAQTYAAALNHREQMPLYSAISQQQIERSGTNKQGSTESTAIPQWQWLGPDNAAGRMRTLAFDPNNSNRMYAGGVTGGLWRTDNAGANWVPIGDNLANINIGSLALHPSNSNIIYIGTGELYRNNQRPYSAMWGQGIFRSTDGGISFQHLLVTANDNFRYVADLEISPHNPARIYAATNTGVWRSDNSGVSFVQILAPLDGNDLLKYEGCNDLMLLPDASKDVLLATCSSRSVDDRYNLIGTVIPPACGIGPCQASIFRNPDAANFGAWQSVLSEPGMGRTQMAYAPSNPQIVYASSSSIVPGYDRTGDGIGDYENGLHAIFRSVDGGLTWAARLRNNSPDALSTYIFSYAHGFDAVLCGFGATSVYSAGWFNHAIAVNPQNPNRIWVAGMELYRSDDGGLSFGKGAYWWYFPGPEGPHADQHVIKYHPAYDAISNPQMYVGNDGGIGLTLTENASVTRGTFASCQPGPGSVSWQSISSGLGTGQYYTGAVTRNGDIYVGGLQDNGTKINKSNGASNNWTHILGGDGAFVAIDPRNPQIVYASYQNISLKRSENGGASFVDAHIGIVDTPIFIMPYVMDMAAPDRLYGGGAKLWRTNNRGASWAQASANLGNHFSDRISALAVSPVNSNYMLFGNNKAIFRSTSALSSNASTVWPSVSPRAGWVSSITHHSSNANIAYATYSTFGGNHVWKTVDAGASWQPIDGVGKNRLPDIPVHTLAIDPSNTHRLFIGTDLGIFVSVDDGQNWAVENTGFANVIVESLQIAPGDGVTPAQLFAFTYGRGVWKVPLADLDGVADYMIGADINGMFYDLSQDGHGWIIENVVIDGVDNLLAYWFTYINGEQHWVLGTGPVNGDKARLQLWTTRDGDFPPNFDPADLTTEAWGEVLFEFDSKDQGQATWTTTYPGALNGTMNLSKLSELSEQVGTHDPASPVLKACHSGSWYNPAQSGHGFSVHIIDQSSGRALIVWYTFLSGKQVFLVGTGNVVGNQVLADMHISSGGGTPPVFNPATVLKEPWGTVLFELSADMNQAQVSWQPSYAGFAAGSMPLARLAQIRHYDCLTP